MRRYRIAYFTADCNYELVESTLQGVKQYVDDHPLVSLCAFNVFGTSREGNRNLEGFSVFDLADLSCFDGLLIQGNQITPEKVRAMISQKVISSGIPAVSVDCPIEGCTMIGLDNRRAQMDITEHLIKDHQAKRLVYLTGDMTNKSPNGPLRMKGFLDACEKYGIEEKVIPCFWKTSDGYKTGKEWIDSGKKLPDAFVCANDEMAIGIIEALAEGGFNVPKDVRVTGFDRIGSADLSAPSLSTIDREFSKMNYHAMERLISIIDGESKESEESYPYKMILAESCGCHECRDLLWIKDQYFRKTRFLQKFNPLHDRLTEDLIKAADLPQLMRIFQGQSDLLGCGQAYVCVKASYFDRYGQEENEDTQSSSPFGKEMVMLQDAGEGNPEEQASFVYFDTSRLLPGSILDENRFMIFYPLQSDTGIIGYLATCGISEITRMNLHQSLLGFLGIAMENVQKNRLLSRMKDRFEDLYVHDKLTGLYNRFGLEKYGKELFFRLLSDKKGVRLMFVDVDRLKNINDEYGHDLGDRAILSTAQILQSFTREDCFLMRYGGDEFLIITPLAEDYDEEKIREAAKQYSDLPFYLGLSIGSMQITDAEGKSLEDWIHEADLMMYEEKRRKKEIRRGISG